MMDQAQDRLGFIHRFEPGAETGGPAPVLLLLHGTGGDEHDLIDIGHALLPGAPLLSPRGKVSEHGAPRFFRRLAEGVFDLDDLRHRTHELADFVEAATEAYDLQNRPVVAVGFSNGANIAASLFLLRPEILSGAVLWRPMVPLEPEQPVDLQGKPIFIGAARFDPLIPVPETERLVALLGAAGADVTTHWQPAGHGLTQEDLRGAATWLRQTWPA